MGPEIGVGRRLDGKMEASTYMANDFFAKELEDELMKFTTNYEDSKAEAELVKQNEEVQRNGLEVKGHKTDVEVNITELSKSSGHNLIEAESQETTESSSSFSGSGSEVDNVDNAGDSEALSNFRADTASALDFDGFGDIFRTRKKKPTTHWRLFIQPLIWRCKWVELQIKKFQSQAQKYERQLKEYSQQKYMQLENSSMENVGVKSLPFSSKATESRVLRRKKRRRTETTDVAAYMLNHNLFSYHENRKCSAVSASVHDELKNSVTATQEANTDDEYWVNDESLCIEPGDGDYLEHMLQKIEFLQSQVLKLKSRTDEVLSQNAGQFSYPDDESLPMTCDALIGSPKKSDSPYNGSRMPIGTYIASQLISEYNKGEVLVPENAITSHGDVVPDENGNRDLASFIDALANVEEDVLIDNQWVKEEMNNFERVKIQPIQSPLAMKDGWGSKAPVLAEPDLVREDQQPPKVRSISELTAPNSKRKRRKYRK